MKLVRSNLLGWRKRKSCLIVGEDGWDMDVLINLTLFYSNLGFKVFFAKKPVQASLIVIMRFGAGGGMTFGHIQKDTPIHIFPYVGHSPQEICNSLRAFPVSLFSPSEVLIDAADVAFRRIVYPPVCVPFWARNSTEKNLWFTHIGNFKKIQTNAGWQDQRALIDILRRRDSHLWGRGWKEIPGIANPHGEAGILNVPEIYSATKVALGLMYPFQKSAQTISGRFWQAPLCGTALVCEEGVVQGLPGVFPIGLGHVDEKLLDKLPPDYEIFHKACDFWSSMWAQTVHHVTEALEMMPPSRLSNVPLETAVYDTSWLLWKHGILYA